jgi:formate-dependent nitrite reductase membrane component NrfD
MILIAGMLMDAAPGILSPTVLILLISLIVSLAMNIGETALPHVSEDVRIATRTLVSGRLSRRFWGLVIGAGLIAPIILASLVSVSTLPSASAFAIVAAVLALAGLWWFEELWVKAGQSAPLS